MPDCTAFIESSLLGALVALKPMSYVIRLGFAVLAFGAAMNVDKTVARVIGFVWLLLTGAGLLLVGIQNGTIVDIVLGVAALGAAGYSWWYTRS
ncbi:hypothetical protein HNR46_000001 [Haloferula luteola]|uniref:Uncharacterized protein n=2 Tax=Haloferula luteola TaxID=595692 RepID=A0A840V757_9BACT|nr:hypothetical protein [Haloferula luteola]